MEPEKEIKTALENENPLDQEELFNRVDMSRATFRRTLNYLMRKGYISYSLDFKIDGNGKSYQNGLIETPASSV